MSTCTATIRGVHRFVFCLWTGLDSFQNQKPTDGSDARAQSIEEACLKKTGAIFCTLFKSFRQRTFTGECQNVCIS